MNPSASQPLAGSDTPAADHNSASFVTNPFGENSSAAITGIFGAIWGVAGWTGLSPAPTYVLLLFLAGGILIVITARYQRRRLRARNISAAKNPFRIPAYRYAVLFELIAIPIAVALLVRAHRPEYVMPAVSLIVGLHFLGLVRAFCSRRHLWIALAMTLLSILTMALLPAETSLLAHRIELWTIVPGWGCAAILWVASLQNLHRARAFLLHSCPLAAN